MPNRPRMSHRRITVEFLSNLVSQPDVSTFRVCFDQALTRPMSSTERQQLRSVGAEAFVTLLSMAEPNHNLLVWFAQHYDKGNIEPTERLAERLAKFSRQIRAQVQRERYAGFDETTTVVQTKRVVQLSWFGLAGWQSSDAFEIRRSVFRSVQERAFMRALRERFPHLGALPNYPLDQICNLGRLRSLVGDQIWRYGLHCRLDAVLVTPQEGDPVAAFELDSRLHDDPDRQQRDAWRDKLLMLANVPFFRLRSEDPQATSPDEWYQILTEEVAYKVNVGERMRNRDLYSMLVPIVR